MTLRLDQRLVRRTKTFLPTQAWCSDGPMRAHVLDLSPVGARVHLARSPIPGNVITVEIDLVALTATIVWTDGQVCGLVFDQAT